MGAALLPVVLMKCDRRIRCSRTGMAQRFERKRECEQRLDERACVVVRGTTNGEKKWSNGL